MVEIKVVEMDDEELRDFLETSLKMCEALGNKGSEERINHFNSMKAAFELCLGFLNNEIKIVRKNIKLH